MLSRTKKPERRDPGQDPFEKWTSRCFVTPRTVLMATRNHLNGIPMSDSQRKKLLEEIEAIIEGPWIVEATLEGKTVGDDREVAL